MQAINVSIGFDRRLAPQDLKGSRAHAAMLRKQGVISSEDEAAIQKGLDQVAAEIASGAFPFREEFEDIHFNVEKRLDELIGPAAGRLHTARSRNDQVAVDFRLWVRDAIDGTLVQSIDMVSGDIALSPDGQFVAAIYDGDVGVYKVSDGSQVKLIPYRNQIP